MSTKRDREHLKTYFETGDRPTEGEFIEFIDSIIVQNADHIWVDADSDAKNVGIGTESPKQKLDVNGNAHLRGTIYLEGHISGDKSTQAPDQDLLIVKNGSEIQLFSNRYPGREGDLFLIGNKDNNGSGKIVFSQQLGPSAWRNNVVINTDGKVGIGTENPQDALQIGKGLAKLDFGSAYGEDTGWGGAYIGFNTARNLGSWTTETDGGNNGAAVIYSDVSGGLNFATLATKNPSVGGQTHSDQSLFSNIKLKIRNNGNVGIGTVNPESKLEVNNGPSIKGESTGLRLPTNAGDNRILVSDSFGNTFWRMLTDSSLAGNSLVPQGIIVMWSGMVLPNSEWHLCDGNNGIPVNGVIIPDLRGRFIVGYNNGDNDYAGIGNVGPNNNSSDYDLIDGGKKVKLKEGVIPIHTHHISANKVEAKINGNHDHGLSELRQRDGIGGSWGLAVGDNINDWSTGYKTDGSGNHTHQVEGVTDSFGKGNPVENRPPYYVLAFIIKV